MKKVFWIGYGIVFLGIIITGYVLLKTLRRENEELVVENEKKKAEIENIEKAIRRGTLPNKEWPGVYRRRLETYRDIEARLAEAVSGYNTRIHRVFEGVSTELFDGAFKKRWLSVLRGLLADGFLVNTTSVTLANVQELFETGDLSRKLGIPMSWVQRGGNVLALSERQRRVAEENFWIQACLIDHFKAVEKQNGDWNAYLYRRKEPAPDIETAAGAAPGKQPVDPPGVVSIVCKVHGDAAVPAASPFGTARESEGPVYKVEKKFYTEYHFTAVFRIRFSSIPRLLNNLFRDESFFFVIDGIDVQSLSSRGDAKPGRPARGKLGPENEPPVRLTLEGRIVEFHFLRGRNGRGTAGEGTRSALPVARGMNR